MLGVVFGRPRQVVGIVGKRHRRIALLPETIERFEIARRGEQAIDRGKFAPLVGRVDEIGRVAFLHRIEVRRDRGDWPSCIAPRVGLFHFGRKFFPHCHGRINDRLEHAFLGRPLRLHRHLRLLRDRRRGRRVGYLGHGRAGGHGGRAIESKVLVVALDDLLKRRRHRHRLAAASAACLFPSLSPKHRPHQRALGARLVHGRKHLGLPHHLAVQDAIGGMPEDRIGGDTLRCLDGLGAHRWLVLDERIVA